jgi:protein-S-isoprenylcysteine O-methyltransferase Ste14
VLPGVAILRRIGVEETELTRVLGDPYRDYRDRTKRLIPACGEPPGNLVQRP